jgi:hypothetical protein
MFKLGSFIILAAISLVGTLFLEQQLIRYVKWELIGILLLILAALLVAFGSWLRAKWTWPLAGLFFAVAAANITLIFISIQEAFLPYLALLGVNVVGFVFAAAQMGHGTEHALENYASTEPVVLDNIMPEAKYDKASSRKARKATKKSKRKK